MTEPDEADWKMARHLAAASSWAAKDVEAIATIIATAKAEERAAVVAWLRAPGTSCDTEVLAEAIERGEHRREGER